SKTERARSGETRGRGPNPSPAARERPAVPADRPSWGRRLLRATVAPEEVRTPRTAEPRPRTTRAAAAAIGLAAALSLAACAAAPRAGRCKPAARERLP